MSKGYKGVRHSGCRSPLMLTLFIIAFVGIYLLFRIPSFLPGENAELQEFLELIKQDYNENQFNTIQITDQDYNNLETKILNTATNTNNPLIVENTLIIDNFVTTDTTLNKQLILSGKDIACLLNLTMQQSQIQDENNSDTNIITINSFAINTQNNITSISGVCKIDMSKLQLDTIGVSDIPPHIYLTLNGEIRNTTNNYIISSSIKVNDLNEDDNQKATNYLKKLFDINDNTKFSDALIDELVRLLRILNSTFNKEITFTTQYILIG